MANRYNLEVGDRVCFWMEKKHRARLDLSNYPWGTVSRVTDAFFFPYWVEWDEPDQVLTTGGFQPSCFNWSEMERVGHTRFNLGRREET